MSSASYDALLKRVCVGLGFCGSAPPGGPVRHVDDFIPETGAVSADQFCTWLCLAEGMSPEHVPTGLRGAIRAAFIEHMGGEVVAAEVFRSSSD